MLPHSIVPGSMHGWRLQVQGHQRVLEIGTGDGRGTLELLRAGHDVFSLDENPACLELAHARLRSAGVDVTVLLRGTVHQGDDGYLVKYRSIELPNPTDHAVLIEGDTLTDSRLRAWLRVQGGFDAITCWLLGSHRARQLNVKLPLRSANQYRLSVQNALYELADVILRSGGVLNIIDRGTIGTTPAATELLRLDVVEAHEEQASPTSLRVESSVHTIAFETPSYGLQMQATPGTSGLVPADVTTGLISVFATKPGT